MRGLCAVQFPLFAMEDIVRKSVMRLLSVNLGHFVDCGNTGTDCAYRL
jgi:hypothetical protein